MYKTKLQELCHQRAWDLPDYATLKEGPDHDPRFQATVTVNGLSFHSQSLAKSSKQAQNDAAKFAFDHFSSSGSSPPPPVSSSAIADVSSNLSSGGTLQFKAQETNQVFRGNGSATIAKNDERFAVSSSASGDFSSDLSSEGILQFKVQEANQIPEGNGPATIAKNVERFTDMQHLYKNQLQSYAQRRSLTLPVYSYERVGPPHASRFKCKVTIDGQTYESQEFFPTLSKAEHAAARAALMSLAPNGVEEDESAYKNLLQELAQKECYRLPTYSTIKSGEAHRPTFVSTVEVEGESFTGQEARTKKQAELSAAKAEERKREGRRGCSTIRSQERHGNSRQSLMVSSSGDSSRGPMVSCFGNSSQSSMPSCSGNSRQSPVTSCSANSSQSAPCLTLPQQVQKVVQFTSSNLRSNLTAYLQQNVQPRLPGHDEKAEEDRATTDVVSRDPPIVSPGTESSSIVNKISSSPGPTTTSLPESSSSSLSHSPTNSAVNTEHVVGMNISCHNKVIVHPRGTNMTYPPGSIVLSMSDDNWVAVQTSQSSK
ncbi:double-stranded RNA-binding protein 1 isoform X3 [Hevea brasiliensis]|uniref:double-stranded RNA-binding protein 1 isoform X3 n=1 Tax=Hevea brasiliensis TaxID=3981 RepID=UPI0025F7CB52|nr:double-stranded RNA-binding protein 1 isoform X3 [Hevea brasiliensis]